MPHYYDNSKLQAITEDIVKMMPPVGPFFESDFPITEYSKNLYTYQPNPTHRQRQKDFEKPLKEKVRRLFNEQELADLQVLTDEQHGLVGGVVDHHGILNNPVLIGVSVVPNFFRMFDRKTNGDILSFATGNNPLGNYFHRRGFMLGGKKLTIFSKKEKDKIVYGLPMQDFKMQGHLEKTKQWQTLSEQEKETVSLVEQTIHSIDFSSCKTFGDQLTKINHYLWPLLFGEDIRSGASRLVSIEYDDIVNQHLFEVIEKEPDSFIARMLLEEKYRLKALQYFEGKTGAWDDGRGTGTQFFWHRNAENEREAMKFEDGKLVSESRRYSVPMELSALKQAVEYKDIYVGMLMKFCLLLFYMGMKPFAGYGSANYLAVMQKDLVGLIKDDYPDEAKRASSFAVNNLTSVPVLIRQLSDGGIDNFFAFDIISSGGLTKDYFHRLDSVPVKNFMAPNLPNMYDYAFNLYGKGDKKDFGITPQDFAEVLGPVFK